MCLALLGATLAPTPARAGGAVCVVRQRAVAGLEADALDQALRLEQRKAASHLTLSNADNRDSCPADPATVTVVTSSPRLVRVQLAGGSAQTLDVSSVDPIDRAQLVARAALAVLATHRWMLLATLALAVLAARATSVQPLVTRGEALEHPVTELREPVDVPTPQGPRQVFGLVEAGGSYAFQPADALHVGGVEVAGGIALLDERLVVMLAGDWQPVRTLPNAATSAELTTGAIRMSARGGPRFGPLLLRFGGGVGWEWRSLTFAPPTRFGTEERASGAALLRGEAELVWRATKNLRLAVGVHGQLYLGGDPISWLGQAVYAAPRGAVGSSLRLGAGF